MEDPRDSLVQWPGQLSRTSRSVALALASSLGACGGDQQARDAAAPTGELALVEERRIDANTADLSGVGYLLVADNGDIIVTQSQDKLLKVFRPDGTTTTMGRGGGGPGEFDRLTRAGWLGDSIWVLDPGLSRISIFGPDYTFVRSFRSPETGLNPDPSASYSVYVQAVLPGGDVRGLITRHPGTTPPPWLADVDSADKPYVRLTPTGEPVVRLAVDPPDRCFVSWRIGTSGFASSRLPYCTERISTGWEATAPLILVDQEATTAGSGSYRVTVISPEGDTTFTRSFAYVPITVNQAMIDSAKASQAERDAMSPASTHEGRPEITFPASRPPIRKVLLGRDGTVWLEEEDNAPEHRWVALDPGGERVASVTLPANVTLRNVERGRIWTLERDADDLESIVVFRLEGKP